MDSESPLVPSVVRADSPLLVAVLALDVERRVLLEVVLLQIEQQQGEPEREKKTASCCIWSTEVFNMPAPYPRRPSGKPTLVSPVPQMEFLPSTDALSAHTQQYQTVGN